MGVGGNSTAKTSVTIEVDEETAKAYGAISIEDRRKIQIAESQGPPSEKLESLLQEV
jgi:hypothetical protein